MVTFGSGTGEDIASLVVELGSTWIKAGYGGEESPKCVIPGWIGTTQHEEMIDVSAESQDSLHANAIHNEKNGLPYYLGEVQLHTPRPNMDVISWLSGDVVDPDRIQAIFQYILHNSLRVDPSDMPILLSEPSYFEKSTRDKIVELLFEQFHTPGIFISKDAVLSAFSQAKSSCLVVDCGGEYTCITPVIDGYALKSSTMKQKLAGHALTEQAANMLEQEFHIDLLSHYEVSRKEAVGLQSPPKMTVKKFPKTTTTSFKDYAKFRLVEDFKESVCQVSETKYKATELALRPARYYEFPTGYNHGFLAERYRIPEILFQPKEFLSGTSFVGLHELVEKSIQASDPEIRTILANNIVLHGGSSLLHGLSDRLYSELLQIMPTQKTKIYTSNNTYERKFAPWIGGSILTSLGSFQQLWLSKSEYEEHGISFVEKRCHL